MEKQLVIFELENESFGIDISAVEGIVKLQEITKVPKAPDYLEGITSLRGSVLSVIDLHKRFGMPEHKKTNETRIVVAQVGSLKVGMIVSGVSEVLTIDDSVIEPPPAMISNVNQAFITGVAKIDTRLVILLDLEKVLTAKEADQIGKLVSKV
jgi:purine-binding chemotaxis protein CheW